MNAPTNDVLVQTGDVITKTIAGIIQTKLDARLGLAMERMNSSVATTNVSYKVMSVMESTTALMAAMKLQTADLDVRLSLRRVALVTSCVLMGIALMRV